MSPLAGPRAPSGPAGPMHGRLRHVLLKAIRKRLLRRRASLHVPSVQCRNKTFRVSSKSAPVTAPSRRSKLHPACRTATMGESASCQVLRSVPVPAADAGVLQLTRGVTGVVVAMKPRNGATGDGPRPHHARREDQPRRMLPRPAGITRAPIGARRFYNLVRHGYYDGVRFFGSCPAWWCSSASVAIPRWPRPGAPPACRMIPHAREHAAAP